MSIFFLKNHTLLKGLINLALIFKPDVTERISIESKPAVC